MLSRLRLINPICGMVESKVSEIHVLWKLKSIKYCAAEYDRKESVTERCEKSKIVLV